MEILIWLIGCGAVAYFAQQRGRNPVLWGLASLVGSPLIVGVVLACQRDEKMQADIVKTQMDTQQVKERVALNEMKTKAHFESIGASINGLKSNINGILNAGHSTTQELPVAGNRFKGVSNSIGDGNLNVQHILEEHRQKFVNENVKAMSNVELKETDSNMKQCPSCGEMIRYDAIKCRFCGTDLHTIKMVECPFCKEMIREDAQKCKYCRSEIPQH